MYEKGVEENYYYYYYYYYYYVKEKTMKEIPRNIFFK